MTVLRRPKALLFDLDDTLIVGGTVKRFIDHLLLDHKLELPGVARRFVFQAIRNADREALGVRDDFFALLYNILEQVGSITPQALRSFWEEHFPTHVCPEPRMAELLDYLKLKGFSIGVVTNGGVIVQGDKMAAVHLTSMVDVTVACGGAEQAKPAPNPFLQALDALKVTAGEAWFIGDHPEADIFGAVSVGMVGVWKKAARPWDPKLGAPSAIINELAEVIYLLQQAEGEIA